MSKNSNKPEKISDDYVTDEKKIQEYVTNKKKDASRIKIKEVIDEVLLKDLNKGDFDNISEHIQALVHDASPDDLEKLKD